MQKNHAPDSSLYWYTVTELEWYGATQDARTELVADCQREANELGAKYANIMVEPDAVMSISPIPKRHIVWRASPAHPTLDLGAAVADLCARAAQNGMAPGHIADILDEVKAQFSL